MIQKILIVDDVLPNVLLLEGYVKRLENVETVTFTNPAEALGWCATNELDLVMLDYLMPEMDGCEFLHKFRNMGHLRDVPVVIVTIDQGREALYRALDAGANDFLRKPVDDAELIARVRNMLLLRARQTELQAARREAEASNAILVKAQSLAKIGNWQWSIERNELVFCSDEYARIHGVTPEEVRDLMKHRTERVIHPEDRDRVAEVFRKVDEEGLDHEIEYRIVRPNGDVRYVFESVENIFDASGRPVKHVGIIQDITERKVAEEALLDSEERLRSVIESSPDSIVVKDREGRFQTANRNFFQRYDLTEAQVLGRTAYEFHPKNIADHHAVQDRIVIELGTILREDLTVTFATGREHVVAVTRFPLIDSQGQISGVGSISADVTEQREAEYALRQAQKMESIGQLVGGVAHDFNNLLAIILGNAQLLEDRIEDDDARELLGAVIRATQRGADLTSRLLAFSRRQPLNSQIIDIGKLCMGMTDLLRRSLGEMIEIDLRIAEQSSARADPGQLENALLNLALNARDAMPGGGKLTIETENVTLTGADMNVHPEGQPGDYVVLKVSDSGTGMAPDVLEKVFDPFFTTKEVGAGSGLGLSMVYGFAQQSGGHVTIQSEEGHGTKVALYLPQAEAATEDAHRETTGEAIPKGRGETVLVVEDEPALRQLAVKQLESLGYKTLEAPDGPVALEFLANSHDIDLLLSDVVLPGGMSGPEIYVQAKEQRPDLRCLLMSGYAVTAEGALPGGVNLLSKPFDIAKLAQMLRSTLVASVRAIQTVEPPERVIG